MPLLTGELTVELREAVDVPISSASDSMLVCCGSIDSVPRFFRTLAVNKIKPTWTEKFVLNVRNAERLILHCGSPTESLAQERRHPIIILLHKYLQDGHTTFEVDEWVSAGENSGKVHVILKFKADPKSVGIEPLRHEFDGPQLHSGRQCSYCDLSVTGSSVLCLNCNLVIHVNCRPFVAACCPGQRSEKKLWADNQHVQKHINTKVPVNVVADPRRAQHIVYGRRRSSGSNLMPSIVEPDARSIGGDQILHTDPEELAGGVRAQRSYMVPREKRKGDISQTDLKVLGDTSPSNSRDVLGGITPVTSPRSMSAKKVYLLSISNVLARNIPAGIDASVAFHMADINLETERVKSTYPVFKLHGTTEFTATQTEFEKLELKIELKHHGKTLASFTFKAEDMLVGPRHYDVQLASKGGGKSSNMGRVRADIKLEERCEVLIELNEVLTESLGVMNRCPFKIRYCLLVGDTKSDVHCVSQESPVTREPSWNQSAMPLLEFESTRTQLTDTRIHFELIRLNTSDEHGFDSSQAAGESVHGEAFFSLVKVFQQIRRSEIIFRFRTTLQHEGTSAGFLIGSLKLTGHPKRFQLQGGVMTEHGISAESPVVMGESAAIKGGLSSWWKSHSHKKHAVVLPQEMDHMKSLINQLTIHYTKPYRKRIKTKEHEWMSGLVADVCSSHKVSMTSFVYSNHESMIGAVKIFLVIWNMMLNHLDDTVYENKKVAFQLIIACMQRSELVLLLHLFRRGPHADRPFELAKEVIIQVRSSMYRTLSYCLNKMNSRVMFGELKVFTAKVVCIACYMIPSILKKVQEAILPKAKRNTKIEEWGVAQFSLEESVSEALDPIMFEAIYNDFEDIPYVDKAVLKQMEETLPYGDTWVKDIESRQESFYHTAGILANHMYNRVVLHEGLQWHMVPGYRYVVKAVLIEMDKMSPDKYSNAMLRCQDFLICNPDTLTTLMALMFKNTRAQDIMQVSAAINHLDGWFSALEVNFPSLAHHLPKNFNYDLLLVAIERLLENEHCQVIMNTVNLLLAHVDILTHYPPARDFIYKTLLVERHFFRLFLHYDDGVREYFHSLVTHLFLAQALLPTDAYETLYQSETARYVTRMNEFGDVETWLYHKKPNTKDDGVFNTETSRNSSPVGIHSPSLTDGQHTPPFGGDGKIPPIERRSMSEKVRRTSGTEKSASDTMGTSEGGRRNSILDRARSSLKVHEDGSQSRKGSVGAMRRSSSLAKNLQNIQAEQQETLEHSLQQLANLTDCRIQFHDEGVTRAVMQRIEHIRQRARDYQYTGSGLIDPIEAHGARARGYQFETFSDELLVYIQYALPEFDKIMDEYKEVSRATHKPPELPIFEYQQRMQNYLDMSE